MSSESNKAKKSTKKTNTKNSGTRKNITKTQKNINNKKSSEKNNKTVNDKTKKSTKEIVKVKIDTAIETNNEVAHQELNISENKQVIDDTQNKDLDQPVTDKSAEVLPIKKTRKKIRKGFIILAGIALLIICLVICYVFVFKLKATLQEEGKTKTKDGVLNFNVKISSNKPILKVLYAIDPKDENDIKSYTKINADGSLFRKNIDFKDLSIPVGKRQLCFYVESILGTKDVECIDIEFDIGYIAKLNPNNIKKISTDTYIVSDELVVTFGSDVSNKKAKELIEKVNGEIVGELYYANIYQIKINGDINSAKELLSKEENVLNVSYNYLTKDNPDVNKIVYNKIGAPRIGGDIHFSKKYQLSYLDADKAYKEVTSPTVINVGLIDSPIDYRHKELNTNKNNIFIPQTDQGGLYDIDHILSFYKKYNHDEDNEFNKDDINGCGYLGYRSHGTHVSGIMSAKHDKDGIDGINDNVNLFYASHWYYFDKEDFWDEFSDDAKRYYGRIDGAMAYAGDTFSLSYALSNLIMSNVRVINMSISFTNYSDDEYNEYKKYFDNFFNIIQKTEKDFVIAKSAGNDYGADATSDLYNRILSENEFMRNRTIIVGSSIAPGIVSTNSKNILITSRADYSNTGEIIDIFAPGTIYSSIYNDDYEWMIGTSQATPLVAGTASLLYSYNPDLKAEDVKGAIVNGTKETLSVNKKMYGVLNTYLALQVVKEFIEPNATPAKKDDTKYGFIQGTINDAKTNKPPTSNGTIIFTDVNDSSKKYVAADEEARYLTNGNYDFILPIGTYNMEIKFNGYVSETEYNIKISEETVTYNVLLKLVNTENGTENGFATGYVVDAFNGEHIPNAKIKIYRGISNVTENLVTEISSDTTGSYKVELEPGNYTAYASADNYVSGKSNILVLPKETTNNQNCTITPVLKEGEIRAILTWGENPRDLDSHLVGPTPDGSRFHIYYSNKSYYYNSVQYDNLDVDDTSSYGPETTSVYVGVDGTYTYYVQDFSNRSSDNSNALSLSGAQVKLYKYGVEEPIVFNVPNKDGTLWKVFSIKNGELVIHNEMSYHSDQSTVGN